MFIIVLNVYVIDILYFTLLPLLVNKDYHILRLMTVIRAKIIIP